MKLSPEATFALTQGGIYVRLGHALVAIDPGTASCGWYVRIGGLCWHGQSAGAAEAVAEVLALIGDDGVIGLLGIEEPGFIAKGNQWKLAWCGGEVRGRLAAWVIDERCVWLTKEAQWRSHFAFKRGLDRAGGETANSRILEWSELRAGFPLHNELDRANAFALGETMFELITKQEESRS